MQRIILYIFLLVLFATCKKDKKLPPEPTIELVSVTPSTVVQFKDSVEVTIKYTDNDGDLGDDSPDEYSLQVKDSRLANPDYYHIPPLAPSGSELKIEGQLKIKLNTLFLLGNGNEEFSTLTIKLKDRAGHWSNEISTPSIAIHDSI